jgi:hypothetical protein
VSKIAALILIFSGSVYAQSSSRVIKLKEDVIQGRRLRPQIFLEFESHSPNMDSIIYKRLDFADFQREDGYVRLQYVPTETEK